MNADKASETEADYSDWYHTVLTRTLIALETLCLSKNWFEVGWIREHYNFMWRLEKGKEYYIRDFPWEAYLNIQT